MFIYNDVIVEYSQRVEKEYDKYSLGGYFSRVVHILEVKSLDIEVTVTCETNYEFSRAVVISTLLAALKNVDDGFIYSLARKKVESQMGFQVDDLIPGYVAKQTDVDYDVNGAHFNFNVVAPVCRGKIHKPNLVAMKQDGIAFDSVIVRLEYYSGVHKGYIDMEVPDDTYHDFAALQHVFDLLWIELYKKAPMLAPDLSYMRYTEGLLNGGKYHNGKFVSPTHDPYLSEPLVKPAKKAYGGKDSRVDELPGVHEMVKHPVSGNHYTLEKVIISLNDQHKWTRERIASWLEEIHDPTGENGPNLNFEPKS